MKLTIIPSGPSKILWENPLSVFVLKAVALPIGENVWSLIWPVKGEE